jgi:hypothetical protein
LREKSRGREKAKSATAVRHRLASPRTAGKKAVAAASKPSEKRARKVGVAASLTLSCHRSPCAGVLVRLGWSSGCAEVSHSPGLQRGWQGTPKFLVALPPPPRLCALLGIELVAAKSSVRTSLSCPPWPCTRFVHARTGFNLLMRRVACSRVWRRRVGRVPPPPRPRRGQRRPCVVDVLVDR